MKMNLKVFLPAVVVMLFMLSLTGYAHGVHDDPTEIMATGALENSMPVLAVESLVSRWLEIRLAEELAIRRARGPEYTLGALWIYDEEFEFGGGWCNNCGCWLRHGCDPNGNCSNGHWSVCSANGPSCTYHSGDCFSSE